MRKRVLITGGAGFAGHHLVEHLLVNTDWDIVVIDKLNYASMGFDRLRDIKAFTNNRVVTLTADIGQLATEGLVRETGTVHYFIHMAAETHVDNSIKDPGSFVQANVVGTYGALEMARKMDSLENFVYFSTDEVFGPAPEGVFYKEWDRYNCTNPYSATKAGGEELALAYANTYGLPVIVTHTMNLFGERQHPEKFIPLVMNALLDGETIKIHSNPEKTKAGTRHYIHCRNMADALMFILKKGPWKREKFNIVGEKEVDNLTLAQLIAESIGKPLKYELVDFHSSRPGHDLRYALDGNKLSELGWKPSVNFEESLRKTVKWSLNNSIWLKDNKKYAA
ncbi:MAG: GDP-mannose 4,6-dehydratase [Bdellovibrionaceae bacterium]|nr:GDP-mannose 4,6-dehydratase [Pseudobdellovibrionaceae bacterium]